MIGLGFQNIITAATSVAGGSWLAALPATNATTRNVADTARSTDDATASTKLIFDNVTALTARVLVVRWHNLSSAATVRWKRGTTSGAADVDDSTALNAWQITPLAYEGHAHQVIVVLNAASAARYDTVEFADTTNPDGYVEVGQIVIAPLVVTSYNASYGLRHGLIDLSTSDRSDGGTPWVNKRRRIKTAQFQFELLDEAEGNTLHEIQRMAGTTDQIIYVPRIGDKAEIQRYGGVGSITELSEAEYPRYQGRKQPFRWTED